MTDVSYAGLVIPVKLRELGASPNERLHWAVRSQRNALVRYLTMWACHAALPPARPWWGKGMRCRIETNVVLGKGRRTRDADNLTAALKPAVDGLKDAGILVDDTPEWLESTVPSQTRGTDPLFTMVVFTVTPLGESR